MENEIVKCALCGREQGTSFVPHSNSKEIDGLFYCRACEHFGDVGHEIKLLEARYPSSEEKLGALVYMANQHEIMLEDRSKRIKIIKNI